MPSLREMAEGEEPPRRRPGGFPGRGGQRGRLPAPKAPAPYGSARRRPPPRAEPLARRPSSPSGQPAKTATPSTFGRVLAPHDTGPGARSTSLGHTPAKGQSINPLTGLNPLQPGCQRRPGDKGAHVAIPLRCSIPCNATIVARPDGGPKRSQSPYGAQSLATLGEGLGEGFPHPGVAIPLRGSIPCNGTPQRTPSWTAPPEGGFVRKMKLGICTRRITGVFEGLHR